MMMKIYKNVSTLVLAFVVALSLNACANAPQKPTLSDLKSRYWQGTYYLSVKESPTSIKCTIESSYQVLEDIPVIYKEQDATELFKSEEDQEKIRLLRQQCFEKSKTLSSSE